MGERGREGNGGNEMRLQREEDDGEKCGNRRDTTGRGGAIGKGKAIFGMTSFIDGCSNRLLNVGYDDHHYQNTTMNHYSDLLYDFIDGCS